MTALIVGHNSELIRQFRHDRIPDSNIRTEPVNENKIATLTSVVNRDDIHTWR